jgi:hypothetical protein
MHALKPFSGAVDITSRLKLVMPHPSTLGRIDLDEPEHQTEIRGLIWQFPDGNGANLIAAIQMNPDEAARHIDVVFLELGECEFIDSMIVEHLGRITICLELVAVRIRMKHGGDCIKEVFFRTKLPLPLNPIPHLPEELLDDACDVLSSIIMTWNLSEWMPESDVIERCQLHERALQEGHFDDRRHAYRLFHNFHNFFACFPNHAARVIRIEYLTPVFNFAIETDLISMEDYWRTMLTFVVRAV